MTRGPLQWEAGDRVKCKEKGHETTTGLDPYGHVGTVETPRDGSAVVDFDYTGGRAEIPREHLDWISRPGSERPRGTWKVRDRVRLSYNKNGSITAHPNRARVLVVFDGSSEVEEVERERLEWLRRPGQRGRRRGSRRLS